MWAKNKAEGTNSLVIDQVMVPTALEYQSSVQDILLQYRLTEDRLVAYDALFSLIVPAEMRRVHIELILLFDNESDLPVSVYSGLEQLKNDFPWIP